MRRDKPKPDPFAPETHHQWVEKVASGDASFDAKEVSVADGSQRPASNHKIQQKTGFFNMEISIFWTLVFPFIVVCSIAYLMFLAE
jgi:hypothetical protein